MAEVVTRFAPSPTGFMHVGGVRTALFAWLIARQAGGKFILRIEDTDRARLVEGATEHIQASLEWLGLTPDSGPIFQSERLEIYRSWAEKLIATGRAYADPYTKEEVDTFREMADGTEKPFRFRDYRPKKDIPWDGKMPLRFRSDAKDYTWHDEVMGDLHAGADAIDDFVLIKSDGYPTYNFAHIVDDFEMKISHIIRGQEFIASTPNYLNLYEALEITPPKFVTVPPILAPSGNKKLGKRDGAKDVLDYQAEGYSADAMVSFLATLGWNDGTDQEVFSRDELIEKFSIDRVQRSGARFDERHLLWTSGHFIRQTPVEDLANQAEPFWPDEAAGASADYKLAVLKLVQERLKFLAELPALTGFFFGDWPFSAELIGSNKQLKKFDKNELIVLLDVAKVRLELSDFSVADLGQKLNDLLDETNQKPAVLFSLIRIATTNAPSSPALADTLNVLGKQRSLDRMSHFIDDLEKA